MVSHSLRCFLFKGIECNQNFEDSLHSLRILIHFVVLNEIFQVTQMQFWFLPNSFCYKMTQNQVKICPICLRLNNILTVFLFSCLRITFGKANPFWLFLESYLLNHYFLSCKKKIKSAQIRLSVLVNLCQTNFEDCFRQTIKTAIAFLLRNRGVQFFQICWKFNRIFIVNEVQFLFGSN